MARLVLVCGGRNYEDFNKVHNTLNHYLNAYSDIIVQGGARGADALAKEWGREYGVPVIQIDAEWAEYGKAAGVIRNKRMLRLEPDLVIAFPGGKGTANMIELAKEAGVEVIEVGE